MPNSRLPLPNTPDEGQQVELPPPPRYQSAMGPLRHVLFGRALPTSRASHEKLPKFLALPIFSSDALSSVAYATEAIVGILILKGTGALHFSLGIAFGIALLMIIVIVSYRQIIFAYPDGGGAYPVSRDNLGVGAALIAGAALLIDYVLTVAVSVAAGIAAIVTFAPHLSNDIVLLCLLAIGLITIANLRGVRETGGLFAAPTYIFIVSILATIIAGLIAIATHAPHVAAVLQNAQTIHNGTRTLQAVGLYFVLQAFSQGCTALTGVEAISNTVPLFKEPQDKNAAATMVWMGVLAITMFFGLTYLADQFGIYEQLVNGSAMDNTVPGYKSVVGMVAEQAWPHSMHWMFYVVQVATAAVLVLAANTAFAGFPQLASMLARDNFLPRQLANLGDRLAFSNGIMLLAVASAALIWLFHGRVDALLSLYAIGVFTSFTLAQAGMVRRWLRMRTPGWQGSLVANFLGAIATGAVTIIIGVSKFADGDVISQYFEIGPYHPHYGAWLVIVLVPIFVWMFYKINTHYRDLAEELSLDRYVRATPSRNVVLVLVPRLHRGIVDALDYARLVSDDTRAVYIEVDPHRTAQLKAEWEKWALDIPLVIMESPYRSLLGPLLRYIEAVQSERSDDVVTVIVPELVSRKWWHPILHNQAGPLLRFALSNRRDVIVTNVRYFLER